MTEAEREYYLKNMERIETAFSFAASKAVEERAANPIDVMISRLQELKRYESPAREGESPIAEARKQMKPADPKDRNLWTLDLWLKQINLGGVVHDVVHKACGTQKTKEEGAKREKDGEEREPPPLEEFPLAGALKELGKEGLEQLLRNGECVPKLAEKLFSEAVKATTQKEKGVVNSKFTQGSEEIKGCVELSLGSLSSFFHGLGGLVGPPSVALAEAIERERTRYGN